ncbi:hypothetical protein BG004_005533 [Podila humilis]|nr:hypothetical protein BG004_005533 [Podila humilis]
MAGINRTILILDHSIHARQTPCALFSGDPLEIDLDGEEDIELEPCSMWASQVHAALHYTRLTLDLSPIAIHTAPGLEPTFESIVLNSWASSEQLLAHITAQFHLLQLQDVSGDMGHTVDDSKRIGQALQGSIAHILEPGVQSFPGIAAKAQSILATPHTPSTSANPRRRTNIIMVLVDDDNQEEGEDVDIDCNPWIYNGVDLQRLLLAQLQSLHERIKISRQVPNNDIFTAHDSITRRDYVSNQISRTCTASVFTVRSTHENSISNALTNLYLLQNKDVQVLRIADLPLAAHRAQEIDLFIRKDHLSSTSQEVAEEMDSNVLGQPVGSISTIIDLEYSSQSMPTICSLPTKSAHFASLSPSTFTSSFLSFAGHGSVHLLKKSGSNTPATTAIIDHGHQLFVHCLKDDQDSLSIISSISASRDIPLDPPRRSLGATYSDNVERAHESLIQLFRAAICKPLVDAAGIATIGHVLDTLIPEARPPILPGEAIPSGNKGFAQQLQQQQRARESVRSILSNLWIIGQRFKSISPSHMDVAKLIATKITPRGLDHQTVKNTLIPPNVRRRMMENMMNSGQGDFSGGSPSLDGGDMGDVWNKPRGSMNLGRGGRGGGGGGGGGGRFGNSNMNNSQRGGMSDRGRGRGGGGGPGGPGGHNANNNNDGATGDMMLSMTGKTQPVPYLVTKPQTRDEIEDSEQEYLAQLGDDGCLLKAYWGTRGAQASSLAAVLSSGNNSAVLGNGYKIGGVMAENELGGALPTVAAPATKRPRLQDFAGRTPYDENGGLPAK